MVTIAQSQIVFHSANSRTLALCNLVTSQLRSLLNSPIDDRISEVPLCFQFTCKVGLYSQMMKYTNVTHALQVIYKVKALPHVTISSTISLTKSLRVAGPLRMTSKRRDCRPMMCTAVLHGGVCHRTSTPHISGNKMKEKKKIASDLHTFRYHHTFARKSLRQYLGRQ